VSRVITDFITRPSERSHYCIFQSFDPIYIADISYVDQGELSICHCHYHDDKQKQKVTDVYQALNEQINQTSEAIEEPQWLVEA
jgi:hypothetical protein